MNTENTFQNKENRVVIYDDFATEVIYGNIDESEFPEIWEAFLKEFELFSNPSGGPWIADPNEKFYKGLRVIQIIRRKRDEALFGFEYWVASYGADQIQPNGDFHGFKFMPKSDHNWEHDYWPDTYVFTPVESFITTGYRSL